MIKKILYITVISFCSMFFMSTDVEAEVFGTCTCIERGTTREITLSCTGVAKSYVEENYACEFLCSSNGHQWKGLNGQFTEKGCYISDQNQNPIHGQTKKCWYKQVGLVNDNLPDIYFWSKDCVVDQTHGGECRLLDEIKSEEDCDKLNGESIGKV